jgi:hypothetical protein
MLSVIPAERNAANFLYSDGIECTLVLDGQIRPDR